MRGHNCEPIDAEWLDAAGELSNGEIEVRPLAITNWYDGIEIWRCEKTEDDDDMPDGILAVHWFPITKGDVRNLCAALNVPCNA